MKMIVIILISVLTLVIACYAATTTINAFNAGELSALLEGRTDIAKYYTGCRILENFLPYTYGGVTKRPGTMYIADTNDNGKVRLMPFEFSVDDAYIIEAGEGYMRFYTDDE